MNKLFLLILLISINCFAQTSFELKKTILNTTHMQFETHIGRPDSMENALALNIEYNQIVLLRGAIEKHISKRLKFLTAWDPNGEAHITTISPVEFSQVLRHHISMQRINQIAREVDIQNADLKILGLGSGIREMDGAKEETFFLIVDSFKLRKIRHKVYSEFLVNGGSAKDFDPAWFFPHITIGYTKKDIHENSGLLKNIKHTLDKRFFIKLI